MRRTILIAAAAALVLMPVELTSASAADTQTTEATAPMEVQEISDVLYQVGARDTSYVLDVYRPTEDGPWPVVVMLHGAGSSGRHWGQWISAVAEQGAVVFVPTWPANLPMATVRASRRENQRVASLLACSVRFARTEAETYGGDPSNLTIFGHSFGANFGSVIAFGNPKMRKGCVASSGSVVPENLVFFEGEWLLMMGPFWTDLLQADPGVMDDVTPWSYLDGTAPFPTRIFVSELSPEYLKVPLGGDPWAEDSWLALRDPTGELRSELQELGAFEDRWLDVGEGQALLQHHLDALGYEASLGVFPKSKHTRLSKEGLQLLVDAILQRS